MGKYEKDWARRQRAQLMAVLGNCCAWCGTTEQLEFDCKEPRGDAHHKYDTSHRMSFYRRQHREGNLQILCTRHNAIKGLMERAGEPGSRGAGDRAPEREGWEAWSAERACGQPS